MDIPIPSGARQSPTDEPFSKPTGTTVKFVESPPSFTLGLSECERWQQVDAVCCTCDRWDQHPRHPLPAHRSPPMPSTRWQVAQKAWHWALDYYQHPTSLSGTDPAQEQSAPLSTAHHRPPQPVSSLFSGPHLWPGASRRTPPHRRWGDLPRPPCALASANMNGCDGVWWARALCGVVSTRNDCTSKVKHVEKCHQS